MKKRFAILAVVTAMTLVDPLGCEAKVGTASMVDEDFCDDLEMLYGCVIAEAGNQDDMGKRLVIDVVLNRVDSDKFPSTIRDVIAQKNQFSTYPNAIEKALDVTEYDGKTYQLILDELEQRTNEDVLFFTAGNYNRYCKPLFKHGAHYFGR